MASHDDALALLQQVFADARIVADHLDGDAAKAAYRSGLCRDCGVEPHSAGRPRCDQCHRIHLAAVTGGYD